MPFTTFSMAEAEAFDGSMRTSVRIRVYEISKRLVDVVISTAVIVGLAPLWIFLAVLIKIDSSGSVFFATEVIGWKGRHFRILKFRSMVVGARSDAHREYIRRNFLNKEPADYDASGRPIFKTAAVDSNQITGVGGWLRRISLDEVPQFWNVLRGDMSIVGPRPSLPYEAELYGSSDWGRFAVRPGITGLYQVTFRNRVSIEEMIQMDLEYVRRRSFWLDLVIMLKTPIAMLKGL